jgi:hypothetical protein
MPTGQPRAASQPEGAGARGTQQQQTAAPITSTPADTVRITGDFNGDGVMDTAFSVLYGRAVEENTQEQYIVRFTGSALPPLTPLPGRQRLINEGDLNGDGADELGFFGEPLQGCSYTMQTFFFNKTHWQELTEPWLIPTACKFLSDEQLQQRVFLENGRLYHLAADANDEAAPMQKRPLPRK